MAQIRYSTNMTCQYCIYIQSLVLLDEDTRGKINTTFSGTWRLVPSLHIYSHQPGMYHSVSFEDDPMWNFHGENPSKGSDLRQVDNADKDHTLFASTPHGHSETTVADSTRRYAHGNPVQSPPFFVNEIRNNDPSMKNNDKNDWNETVGTLKQALGERDERIQRLELENVELRAKLKEKDSCERSMSEEDVADGRNPKPFVHQRNLPHRPRSTSNAGHSPLSSYPSSSLTTPGRSGAQFVAEFTQVMDLNVGHHTLLASIMERHYERQSREHFSDERFR